MSAHKLLTWTVSLWTNQIPSVLILRAVRTRAKSVALKVTIPSAFRGMFIATRRWERGREAVCVECVTCFNLYWSSLVCTSLSVWTDLYIWTHNIIIMVHSNNNNNNNMYQTEFCCLIRIVDMSIKSSRGPRSEPCGTPGGTQTRELSGMNYH